MRAIFLLNLFSILMLHAAAQQTNTGSTAYTISGSIINGQTNEPLPGASVYLADARMGGVADENGNFRINRVPGGHHIIEISYTGFNSIVVHIDLHADLHREFRLMPAIVENLGVTVTGVSNATSIRKAPVPISTLRRDDLLRSVSTNIIDALSHEPGISQVSTGPGISKPVIRGLGYNRVVVIHDGVRQEGQQWGDEHGIEIDEQSVQRVEIVKGPASLMYGSDALAGVIHLISNTPSPQGTIRANIITGRQWNNRLNTLHANIAGNIDGINWNAYGSLKSAGDYRNRFDGRVLNSRYREQNAGGYIGLNRNWGFTHLLFSAFHQQPGLIEGERDPATGRFLLADGSVAESSDLNGRDPLIPSQDIRHYRLALDNSFAIGRSRLKLNTGIQQNLRREFGDFDEPDAEELFFDLRTVHYDVKLVLPEMKHWNITIGANGMRQTNFNKGEEAIIPEYRLFDVGGFGYFQRQTGGLTLSGGIRFDNRNIHTDAYNEDGEPKFLEMERDFATVSGSVGATYEAGEHLTLNLNIARGFRAPNLAELSSNGAHEGTNRYEYGDADLKAEKSLQVDGGFEINYEHFSFGVDLFHSGINDFIFYRRLNSVSGGDSIILDDGEELEAFRFSQGNARIAGLEAHFDIHPHPLDWLHIEQSVSFVRGRFNEEVDGSENLPLIPAPRWNSEIRADFSRGGRNFRNVYVRLMAEKHFAQTMPFTGYGTETSTPGYTLLHLNAGLDLMSKEKSFLSIHAGVTNLTDETYQSHLSRLKYTSENPVTGRTGVFNMGRNFYVKLVVPVRVK